MNEKKSKEDKYLNSIFKLLYLIIALMMFVGLFVYINVAGVPDILKAKEPMVAEDTIQQPKVIASVTDEWIAPDTLKIRKEKDAELIEYGRRLIAKTAYYLGPDGIVAHSSNGMNCQNCHLDAGTKIFGNNYSAVASTYPKFRERSGKMESIYKRVNDCFERSLNGKGLDTLEKEMQAIKAYILWLGKDVKKGEKPKGSGLTELKYMARAADPGNGKQIYSAKCQSCHGENGEGKMNADQLAYQYPPLWGEHSYNNGAGLFRLSRFAGYVKANMPFGATAGNPQLTDEEAWDVAAFVNSQPRPSKDLHQDWPKISGKPVDHPFGPYADKFSEKQHKYGPFEPIADFKKKNKATK
ncbi:MAG TPA: c-type cytochrome [Bacteroidia bacterium]|jgi:thiosulfate dehydrogenase